MLPLLFLLAGIAATVAPSEAPDSAPVNKDAILQEIANLKMELSWYEKRQEFELCALVRDEIQHLLTLLNE